MPKETMSLIPKVMTKLPETGDLDTPGRGGSGAGGPGGQAGASGSQAENFGQRELQNILQKIAAKNMPPFATARPVGIGEMFRRLRVKPWAYPEDVDAIVKYVLDLEKKEMLLETMMEKRPEIEVLKRCRAHFEKERGTVFRLNNPWGPEYLALIAAIDAVLEGPR